MAFTKVTGPGIHTLANITSHNINSSGIITATKFVGPLEASSGSTGTFDSLTITGNVSVGGTLTYEDVTNIDSVGIVTAQNGLRVTAGGINVTAGVSTFTGTIDANGLIDADGGANIVGGLTVDQVNVSGVSTYGGNVDINANVDVSGTSTFQDDANFNGTGSGISSAFWTKKLCLTIGLDTPIISVSWKESVPINSDLTCPEITTTGIELEKSVVTDHLMVLYTKSAPTSGSGTPC